MVEDLQERAELAEGKGLKGLKGLLDRKVILGRRVHRDLMELRELVEGKGPVERVERVETAGLQVRVDQVRAVRAVLPQPQQLLITSIITSSLRLETVVRLLMVKPISSSTGVF